MLGGPVLGVAVFLVVAVLLGWGFVSLFKVQLQEAEQKNTANDLDNRFDPEAEYLLRQDLLLGLGAGGQRVMLYPDFDGLPPQTPNRRYVPRVADYLADPGNEKYRDILGVVPQGTRVRFARLIEDPHNRQTRFLVLTVVMDGEHAGIEARGMHLETLTVNEKSQRIVAPREDLFTPAAPLERGDNPLEPGGNPAEDNAPPT